MATRALKPSRSLQILYQTIALAVGIAGAEGLLALVNYPGWTAQDSTWSRPNSEYAPDPLLGWKNRAGRFEMSGSHRSDPFQYTNLSEGGRITSKADVRPEGQAIYFFGDSYVQGWGLKDEETLPWYVQMRHPDTRVANFGTSLYGTYQSYLSLKEKVKGPATAYYLFNGFHEDRNVAATGWMRVPKTPPDGYWFPYASLENGRIQDHHGTGDVIWRSSHWLRTLAMVEDYAHMLEARKRVADKRKVTQLLLAAMNDAVKNRGGHFTVILFDLETKDRAEYREWLKSANIAFIDCDQPEMKDSSLRLPDGHPTGKLNEKLAGWLEPLPETELTRVY